MDDVSDDAPDLEVHVFGNLDGVEVAISGEEVEAVVAMADAFDGEVAVENGNDDGCFTGFEGAVYDKYIA